MQKSKYILSCLAGTYDIGPEKEGRGRALAPIWGRTLCWFRVTLYPRVGTVCAVCSEAQTLPTVKAGEV
jgi:hypothetical protein